MKVIPNNIAPQIEMIPSVFALLYALFALSMTSPSNDAHSGCFLSQVSLFIYFSEFCDIVLLHCLLTINAKARQREKIVNAHLWVLSILFRTTVYKVVDAHVCRVQEACLQLAKVAEAKVKQNTALEIYSNYFQYEQQDCQVTRRQSFHYHVNNLCKKSYIKVVFLWKRKKKLFIPLHLSPKNAVLEAKNRNFALGTILVILRVSTFYPMFRKWPNILNLKN